MEKVIIKGKGKKRLELGLSDILLIDCLFTHQVLKTDQLYKFYTEYLFEKIHPYSFKNRLRKFEEYHLVRSDTFAEEFDGDRFKYYSLGAAGADLLIEQELLPSNFNKKSIYKHLKKENLLHFLGATQAAINILCALAAIQDSGFDSLPPSQHPYEEWVPNIRAVGPTMNRGARQAAAANRNWNPDYKKRQGKWMTIVRPDWIISKEKENQEKRYLNIEFDTGSESLDTLQEKLWKYHLLAEYRPNEKHIVMFVLPDESYSKHYNFKEIDKRAGKIESLFSTVENTERSKEVGLTVCVTTLDLTAHYGFHLLTATIDQGEE